MRKGGKGVPPGVKIRLVWYDGHQTPSSTLLGEEENRCRERERERD
jgi:hypothetical protein